MLLEMIGELGHAMEIGDVSRHGDIIEDLERMVQTTNIQGTVSIDGNGRVTAPPARPTDPKIAALHEQALALMSKLGGY